MGGSQVPLTSMPSLKVSVAVGTAVHRPERELLSHYSGYELLHSATERGPARPGSASSYDYFAAPEFESVPLRPLPIRCR